MGDRRLYPGYESFQYEISTLLSTYPPPFIYVQDTEALGTSLGAVDALLRDLRNQPASECPSKIYYARVDSIACFTARLFYESVINSLVEWEPDWEDGCENWSATDGDVRWNENLDSFLHGLRSAHQHLCKKNGISGGTSSGKNKGKGKQINSGHDNVRLVIVVERVERLKETLPELLVPLTRLAELVRLDVCVMFISQVGWLDIRPPLGASPDPYFVDVQSPSKENVVQSLISNFATISTSSSQPTPYHPGLTSLYDHFASVLCDICFSFIHDPQELHYIAAARWPGFCKPILDQLEDIEVDLPNNYNPSEITRMRLNKLFNPTISAALEVLLPRLTNATDWALANEPPPNLLNMPGSTILQVKLPSIQTEYHDQMGIMGLPRMSKFILLASFLASTNPPKSDIRMFWRGLDEKKRKRKAVKPSGKGPSKVSQRLLGPTPFALDRMIAILGALLEENDADSRISSDLFNIAGEHTDMEIGRVGVFSSVIELTSMRLLHRTTPADRLDGPPNFKCSISYETAVLLAKEVDVPLNDLLWDPV
ncbi:Origin recognition complex subunit 5 [Psilocybe cubensis]|uniref:Origin recognition complex subunit 5 n=2 Tax=Psilocybe cubensis TaxID=181762 RepID=A0ACB8GKM8_PSICU|nr:Origin recognition complex subunit 5 [Psilocybe cubensis]KAH9476054.1 Origin recognition complex subunit 5 [Psilocybe cubensis]